ncbi:MAG: NAD(+)/NADH kinase [Candidatus Neomarinimicrobiota bacterium]
MKIGLLLSPKIEAVNAIVPAVVELLTEHGQTVIVADLVDSALTAKLNGIEKCRLEQLPEKVDALFSVGGDGTFLTASRLMAQSCKPVLGIHLGGLGFLADVSMDNYNERLIDFLNGKYTIEERQGLTARTYFKDRVQESFAFNDFVIDKGRVSTMIKIRTYINEEYLNTYRADGLIIATPTGSTAYSLAAGGPIISPELNVLVVCPICPHSLSVRPVVISADQVVRIDCADLSSDVSLIIDGRERIALGAAGKIEIHKAEFPLRIVRFSGDSFFHTLRQKLNWGRDVRGN